MANFNTHITVAGVVAGVASSALYAIEWVTVQEMVLLWLVATFGGILPDIDSDNSTAIKLIFNLLTAVTCLVAMLLLAGKFSLLELWVTFVLLVVAIRWLVLPVFASFTRHRGVFHSILAGLFFWFSLTAVSSLFFKPLLSWSIGFFCFVGFMIHLTLDEIYSVDLLNTRIKRSFGTALKPFSYKYKAASASMALLTAAAWFATPSSQLFTERYFSMQFFTSIYSVALPKGSFLGVNMGWLDEESGPINLGSTSNLSAQ